MANVHGKPGIRPRRTVESTGVISLPGGTEDNDLWYSTARDLESKPIICSVWVPNDEQRQRIAAGENIELLIWWNGAFPPVAMNITDVKLKGADLR